LNLIDKRHFKDTGINGIWQMNSLETIIRQNINEREFFIRFHPLMQILWRKLIVFIGSVHCSSLGVIPYDYNLSNTMCVAFSMSPALYIGNRAFAASRARANAESMPLVTK